jgi:rhodanese-related sulfurtransferase
MPRSPALATIPLALILAGCSPAPSGGPDNSAGRIDLAQLARAAAHNELAVAPAQLADRVLARRDDHSLLDLRSAEAFAAGHIKTARHAQLLELLDPAGANALPPGRDLVVYGDDGGASAEAATLLRVAGHNAYYLQGGYQGWQAHLHGEPPPASPQEAAKRAAVACWFEGDYVAAAGLVVKEGAAPAAGAYTPPLQPAAPAPAAAPDPLGLGLGLGLGPETAPAPATGRLNVGEGC